MTTNKKIKYHKNFKNPELKNLVIDSFFTLSIFIIITLIITNPTKYTNGTISGLKLFIFSVLPGLFPFMFLTKLITEIGLIFNISQKFDKFSFKLFGTSGISIYAFIMSIVSGYPIGAKIISDLYQKRQISEEEAKKMSIFCTTSGPIFIIGTVGSLMFNSLKIGIILYSSHIISSFLLGIFYNLFTYKQPKQKVINQKLIFAKKSSNIISTCVNQTINSLFVVGAYITIFYLFAEILESLNIFLFLSNILSNVLSIFNFDKTQINGLLYGLLEVTRGAKTLSISSNISSIAITSFILSFSGLSILMQSMAFLKDAKIKAHNFILSKCVHAIFSCFLCYILLIIFF